MTVVAAPAASTPAADAPEAARRIATPALILGLLVALPVAIALAVSFGSVRIPVGDVWAIVGHRISGGAFDPWWSQARERIVLDSRLPRALTAAAVGAALALGGALAQAVTRNPLADPYLLGVSSGAGFGVVLVTVLGVGTGLLGVFTVPAAAFLGALVPLVAALAIGGRHHNVTGVVLVGVAMAQVFTALTMFVLLVIADEHQLSTVLRWLAGGFGDARWSTAVWPAVALAVIGAAALASARWLDLLHAGDDGAAALGMNVRRFRVLVLLGVSVLAAAAVSVAGGIGFIGLLIPHVAGFLVGLGAMRLLPVAALLGAVALVLADLAARAVSASTELPVGVVTALVGAPVFVVMLYRQFRREDA
ncbi:FecCD family ABC transporter permease [Rhodococcus sp. NPDC058505]|uniref:FecCD family ABC transporter permease n=1 Tax=unclassified Rhodococcus (in: high G+C Gram-positive bacteria) TaxID=192944 RepID=UPI003669A081